MQPFNPIRNQPRQDHPWRSPIPSRSRPMMSFNHRLQALAVGILLAALSVAASARAALTATFNVSAYSGGFQGTLIIANSAGSADVTDWTGVITENNLLSSFYGATCTDTASPYHIAPTGSNDYNATIHAGQSVQIGFGGTGVAQTLKLTVNGSSVPVTTSGGGGNSGKPNTPSLSLQKDATTGFDAVASIYSGPYATSYKLLIDGATYTSGTAPAANSQGTQQVTIHITDKPYSAHTYVFAAINSAGTTDSAAVPFESDLASPIEIAALNGSGTSPDATEQARQVTVALNSTTTTALSIDTGATGTYTVASNNATVATATISNGTLSIKAVAPGRAGLRITDTAASPNVSRYLGVRVKNSDGSLPGMPNYLSIGSVSQDTSDDMAFWQGFGSGQENRRVDYRYIYLNGGPYATTNTSWGGDPDNWYGEGDEGLGLGARCYNFVRQCQTLGQIPFFVWYNLDGTGDGYTTDTGNADNDDFMTAYYHDLVTMCNLAKTEAPDDPIGIVIEPDFLGYIVQNTSNPSEAATAATSTPAAVHTAYNAGYLVKGTDPDFADNVQGLVQSINYLFHKNLPNAVFGWEMALWGHPASGFTTPSGTLGLMHKTDEDEEGISKGRQDIYNEAVAETNWYVNAGITSNGASFVSVDKYGLDAVGAQSSAAADPEDSSWFWDQTIWNNYLKFAQAMHTASEMPVVLWQLPVGHINHSELSDPNGGSFTDLDDTTNAHYEDSAPTYFFGDTFDPTTGQSTTAASNRFNYFSGADNGTDTDPEQHLTKSGTALTWNNSWSMAANAGVTVALFGAGTGQSTTGEDSSGVPATDDDWSITAIQNYYIAGPQPLTSNSSAPVITSATTDTATIGAVFSYQIIASNSPTSYNATGLPSGLSVNKKTGVISGTPASTASGVKTIHLSATNASGTGTATLTLTVQALAPVINSPTTATATLGQPFTYQITAANNPLSFNATGLPSGLSVDKKTGLISGTPASTAKGVKTLHLSATNTGGTGTETLTLTDNAANP